MAPKRRQSQRNRENSPPVLETPPPTQQEQIAQLVAQQVAAAIPAIVAQLNQARTSDTGNPETQGPETDTGPRSGSEQGSVKQGCSYKTFMSCKPKEFNGKEGAVPALRWLEETESVFDISNCAEGSKVMYATHSLKGEALTWWNLVMQSRGRDVANSMSWDEFKALMVEKYCPYNEMEELESEFLKLEMVGAAHREYTSRFNELSRLVPHQVTPESKRISRYIWGLVPQIRGMVKSAMPSTFQSAVVLAGTLTDEMIRNGSLANPTLGNKKRKTDNPVERNDGDYNEHNIQNTVESYAGAMNEGRKPYLGNHPLCYKCGMHHLGECRREFVCSKCKKSGHKTKDCKEPSGSKPVCYHCGIEGHMRSACPQLKGKQPAAIEQRQGRA